MRRVTGLFRRGNSFYLRVVLPSGHPLKQNFRNGHYVVSLGPCSFTEANRSGTIKRAEILYDFKPSSGQPASVEPLQLRAIYELWSKSANRSQDTSAAVERSLKLFETVLGNPDIQKLTRKDGDALRSWLLGQSTTTKTARDKLNWVKTLLKYAAQDLELIPKNPWAGLEIRTKTTLTRRPWEQEHLTRLFSHDIWQKGILPNHKKAGGEAAYWIPLLALFTGARLSEICQLEVCNIRFIEGVAVIEITDRGENQNVKSVAGHRIIPIHSKLVQLGFLEFAQSRPGTLLWDKLPMRNGRAGGFFSQYFADLRKNLGIPPDVVFHSFRHNFRSILVEQSISEVVIDRILGHETLGSIGAKIYTHISVTTLSTAVETVKFPNIPLPICFVQLNEKDDQAGKNTKQYL